MRDTLLKVVRVFTVGLAVVAGLSMWLWPLDEPAAPVEAPPPPAAASPATSPAPPTAATPSPAATTPVTAAQLTEHAKQQLALDPEAALADIAQADKLTASSPDALNETRRVLEIHALVRLGKVGLARSLTDRFYRTFPNSDRTAELERLTGYHPRPTGP